jgi:CHAT domain-containing protein
VKKVVLVLAAAFLLAGCAYQMEMEIVGSMLPSLLNKEKRKIFLQANEVLQAGRDYLAEGQLDNAIDSFKQASVLFNRFGNKIAENSVISLLSYTYTISGEHEKGLEYAKRAYEQASQIGNDSITGKMMLVETSGVMGSAYSFLGDFKNAEIFYRQSIDIYNEIWKRIRKRHPQDYATGLNNLANVYAHRKEYDKAITYLTQSLAYAKKHDHQYESAVALTALADVCGKQKDCDKAIRYKQEAISKFEALDRDIRTFEAYLHMANIYLDCQQTDQAYPYLVKHMDMIREKGIINQIWVWELHRLLGKHHFQKKDFQAALDEYEISVQAIEAARSSMGSSQFKTGYLKNKLEVYDEYIQILNTLHRQHPEKGYDRKSLEIFERRQGRAFLEEMGKTGARQYAGLPDEVRNKEMHLEKQIGLLSNQLSIQRGKDPKDRDLNGIRRIERELENAQSLLKQLEQEIEEKYPDYYAIKYPKPVSIEDLQNKLLHAKEAMLVYHVMDDQTILWMISKTHFSSATIDMGRNELNQKIDIFRKYALRLAQQDQRGSVIRLKQEEDADIPEIPDLHALLFPAEIQKRITRAKNLYIVPTGPLYLLPFEALNTKNEQYLIEKHGISYLSSGSLLGILRQSQARRDRKAPYPLLAFANPVYQDVPTTPRNSRANPNGRQETRSEKLSELRNETLRSAMQGNFIELPETEEEAQEIRRILNAPSASDPLQLREKASRNNVLDFNAAGRLDNYRYLVFACHGVIPDGTSIVKQPALVLSHPDPATNGDGFLTISDVFALKMNADLATLSACNTGRGESVPSEGVMGLTRAFMYAGAPAVTVTLWAVNSLAAKELNVGLFKHLKAGKGRMRALRQIKLAMIDGEYGKKWRHPYYWAPVVMFGDGN